MKGFSERNLIYMQSFAAAFPDNESTQQLVAEIPWGHITHILDRVKDYQIRQWYIQKTIENGWSRNVLLMNIEVQTHLKLRAAATNFVTTLPKASSDLAHQLIKSEYNFEFLGLADDVHEKTIEKGLTDNIRQFLLELGNGFAFMGTQYKLDVGGDDFYIDLLFYHTRLRCYVVFELKADKFKPEYAGKLGFYITAINRQVKHETDNPTIGILLCKQANKVAVEYALDNHNQPMGVDAYATGLPQEYAKLLPTQEQFQHLVDTLEVGERREELLTSSNFYCTLFQRVVQECECAELNRACPHLYPRKMWISGAGWFFSREQRKINSDNTSECCDGRYFRNGVGGSQAMWLNG